MDDRPPQRRPGQTVPDKLVRKTLAYLCKHKGARLRRAGRAEETDPQSAASGQPGAGALPTVLLSAAGKPIRSLPARLHGELAASGLIEKDTDGLWRASAAAFSRLARTRGGESAYLFQHLDIGTVEAARVETGMAEAACSPPDSCAPSPGGRARSAGTSVDRVPFNQAESPIARLARPRGETRRPFLEPSSVTAAERLRSDFERGHLQPRITTDWSLASGVDMRAGRSGDRVELTNSAMAARDRLANAIAAVGPEFGGLLLDICCYLKGLETVERERRWPARSAKLVLKLALTALARHYGLSQTASGKAWGEVRRWGSPGYRPTVDGD